MRVPHELPLRYVSLHRYFISLCEGEPFPHLRLVGQLLRQFALSLDTAKRVDHSPGESPQAFGDRGMCGDVAPLVVDGGIRYGVLNGDLSNTSVSLNGVHEMVASGCERSVLSIASTLSLSERLFPWVQSVVEPATVAEVLTEVIDGDYSYLAWEAVVDLLEDVVL